MASINDIGTPGSPMDTPPLTEWQAAVRDNFNSHAGDINALIANDRWLPWTPTLTGGTASVVSCYYRRSSGGLVTIDAQFTIAAITGSLTFSLPVPVIGKSSTMALLTDSGSAFFDGVASLAASTATVYGTGGTGGALRMLTAAVPFAWAAGDAIGVFASYRAAAVGRKAEK